jgi:hypothetical protein
MKTTTIEDVQAAFEELKGRSARLQTNSDDNLASRDNGMTEQLRTAIRDTEKFKNYLNQVKS